MKVAFATQDLACINAHLGWARHLMIYDISAEGHHYLRTVRFRGQLDADGDSGKLAAKLRALAGCALVFVAQVGEAAEARLLGRGITPVRQFAGQPVAVAIEALRTTLRQRPQRWLRLREQRHRRR
ncbi:MAG: nitrogen fixation protein NifX [Rhodospirillales bacterium]|nr:nitrogen fixation protein NifX [Rhodospirillales bacterium]